MSARARLTSALDRASENLARSRKETEEWKQAYSKLKDQFEQFRLTNGVSSLVTPQTSPRTLLDTQGGSPVSPQIENFLEELRVERHRLDVEPTDVEQEVLMLEAEQKIGALQFELVENQHTCKLHVESSDHARSVLQQEVKALEENRLNENTQHELTNVAYRNAEQKIGALQFELVENQHTCKLHVESSNHARSVLQQEVKELEENRLTENTQHGLTNVAYRNARDLAEMLEEKLFDEKQQLERTKHDHTALEAAHEESRKEVEMLQQTLVANSAKIAHSMVKNFQQEVQSMKETLSDEKIQYASSQAAYATIREEAEMLEGMLSDEQMQAKLSRDTSQRQTLKVNETAEALSSLKSEHEIVLLDLDALARQHAESVQDVSDLNMVIFESEGIISRSAMVSQEHMQALTEIERLNEVVAGSLAHRAMLSQKYADCTAQHTAALEEVELLRTRMDLVEQREMGKLQAVRDAHSFQQQAARESHAGVCRSEEALKASHMHLLEELRVSNTNKNARYSGLEEKIHKFENQEALVLRNKESEVLKDQVKAEVETVLKLRGELKSSHDRNESQQRSLNDIRSVLVGSQDECLAREREISELKREMSKGILNLVQSQDQSLALERTVSELKQELAKERQLRGDLQASSAEFIQAKERCKVVLDGRLPEIAHPSPEVASRFLQLTLAIPNGPQCPPQEGFCSIEDSITRIAHRDSILDKSGSVEGSAQEKESAIMESVEQRQFLNQTVANGCGTVGSIVEQPHVVVEVATVEPSPGLNTPRLASLGECQFACASNVPASVVLQQAAPNAFPRSVSPLLANRQIGQQVCRSHSSDRPCVGTYAPQSLVHGAFNLASSKIRTGTPSRAVCRSLSSDGVRPGVLHSTFNLVVQSSHAQSQQSRLVYTPARDALRNASANSNHNAMHAPEFAAQNARPASPPYARLPSPPAARLLQPTGACTSPTTSQQATVSQQGQDSQGVEQGAHRMCSAKIVPNDAPPDVLLATLNSSVATVTSPPGAVPAIPAVSTSTDVPDVPAVRFPTPPHVAPNSARQTSGPTPAPQAVRTFRAANPLANGSVRIPLVAPVGMTQTPWTPR